MNPIEIESLEFKIGLTQEVKEVEALPENDSQSFLHWHTLCIGKSKPSLGSEEPKWDQAY